MWLRDNEDIQRGIQVRGQNIFLCRYYSNVFNGLTQGFPTFLLPCTPSAFRQMNMYPFSISPDKHVALHHFDR